MNESTFLVYVNLIAETLAAHDTLYRIRKSLDWYNSAKHLSIANGIFVDDPTSDNIEMNPILIAVVKMAILDHPADFNRLSAPGAGKGHCRSERGHSSSDSYGNSR